MKIVIAGAGRAGIGVAIHLNKAGHDVTVLERDEAAARWAFEQYGLQAMVGDATNASILRDAGAGSADVVLAMLRRDADNLAVALLARAAGCGRVMVRMRDADYKPVYLAAGVTRILSEIDVLVGALATAVEFDAVKHSMVVGSGNAVAFELVVPPGSSVVGRTVSELAGNKGFPPTCVFAGMVAADGSFVVPRGSSVVSEGMSVLLVAGRAELGAVVAFFLTPAS